mgnify:CR=1 FL=1
MIRFRQLTISRGGRDLLRDADATIAAGERVALIGLNGSGKTSLLSALTAELLPDAGSIEQPFERVIRLEQSLPSSPLPAWQHLLEADTRLANAQQALAHAEQAFERAGTEESESAGLAIAQANAAWLEAGGADAAARARALLSGLGFSAASSEAPVDSLSGGWRMRLNLARALFAPADLLLLDEPTNHLDLDAVLWLERWLVRSDTTMLIVSHDRDFLDRVVKCCLHIDEARLVRYAGGYSDFERQRAARAAQLTREREASAARAAHLEAFIRRFRAQATRARQVQSRIKALERMAEVTAVRALHGVTIDLAPVDDCPEHLVQVDALAAGYGGTAIVKAGRLQIGRGARIGVLGRNGAGKSTLIRTLVGDLPPVSGAVQIARGLRIGYFAQQGVERLREDESPLRHIQRLASDQREQTLRDFLGRFGFRGDDATRAVGPMSGGEKARLLFALLAWQRPQLLVLDEPTNHLDAQTRDSLADALARFDGALLLVSHDRYLLRASVDRFLIVSDGGVNDYDGDLDDYDAWTAQRRADDAGDPLTAPAQAPGSANERVARLEPVPLDRRTERRQAAERRSALAALTRDIDAELRRLEASLKTIEEALRDVDAAVQDPALYGPGSDGAKIAELNRRRAALARDQNDTENRWLELHARRDEQVAAFSGEG